MSLQVESLEDFREYADRYYDTPVFYQVGMDNLTVLAGKVCWKGKITLVERELILNWLEQKKAKRVLAIKELDALFS